MDKLESLVKLLYRLIIIIGIPLLLYLQNYHYNRSIEAKESQISNLKSQIELLKETQYDKALDKIRAQDELFKKERGNLKEIIGKLKTDNDEKDKLNVQLKKSFDNLQATTASTIRGTLSATIAAVTATGNVTIDILENRTFGERLMGELGRILINWQVNLFWIIIGIIMTFPIRHVYYWTSGKKRRREFECLKNLDNLTLRFLQNAMPSDVSVKLNELGEPIGLNISRNIAGNLNMGGNLTAKKIPEDEIIDN